MAAATRSARPIAADDADDLATLASHETRVTMALGAELILASAVIGIAAMALPVSSARARARPWAMSEPGLSKGIIIVLGTSVLSCYRLSTGLLGAEPFDG